MNTPQIKHYYYCENHDDAFFMIIPSKEVNSSDLFVERQCCTKKCTCELMHIGIRMYNNDKLMEDTTPSDKWFTHHAGGYCRMYLDNASQIEV